MRANVKCRVHYPEVQKQMDGHADLESKQLLPFAFPWR